MSVRSVNVDAPASLYMNLFAPGMSLMHRAGLGGLAATLSALERKYKLDELSQSKLRARFGGGLPWSIDEESVTLRFERPQHAAKYLKKLFEFAFRIRTDGLIILPGQFDSEPAAALLADLQMGLVLTFLQHGKVRKLAKKATTVCYDPDGDGVRVSVQYRKCSGFKHQHGWKKLVDKRGCLIRRMLKVDGPINPGAIVRHAAFRSETAVEEPPERLLPLYFAIVGCLALPVNRGSAALIVPEVENLLQFTVNRLLMAPTTASECQITNAADAALQTQLRLRRRIRDNQVNSGAKRLIDATIPGCYAMTFTSTPWAKQQKSRVATINVPPANEKLLNRFDRTLARLPSRIVTTPVEETANGGKKETGIKRQGAVRYDGVVRPLVAENLSAGRAWYTGFARLMTKVNPVNHKPYRHQLEFERKGLRAMISDSTMWDSDDEKLVVEVVHEAIRKSLARIRGEIVNKTSTTVSQTMKNRWERLRERLRLNLVAARKPAHVRFTLKDLFSRGGANLILEADWQRILRTIHSDWPRVRDLGLLALASFTDEGKANRTMVDEVANHSTEST